MTRACEFCGQETRSRFRATDVNRHTTDETFEYFECGTCGALFISPTPPDLGRFYPRDYYALPASRAALATGAEAERYKIDLVRQFVTRGALLEIGPATGGFVHLANDAGFDVTAIEMDAECCTWLRDTVGIEVVHTDDPTAALPAMRAFDVVALWHVIEHVPAPRALFAAAASRLAPGGLLVLAAPNPAALQLRLFGAAWAHLDAPRHLQLLPIALLRRWAGEEGLVEVLATTSDAGTVGWNAFGWQHTLRNMFPASRVGRSAAARLANLCTRVLAGAERGAARGSAYTVAYRRPAR